MQPRNSRLNSSALRGAVDLAAVKAAGEAAQKAEQARAERARQAAAAEADGVAPQSAYQLVIDVTEETFETEVVQRSTEVPVVIDFWAEWCGPCKQLSPILEGLAEEYAGAFVLAKIDVDANQLIAQQFGIQGIPAVMAVVAGQLVPLFQGAESAANVRKVLDQLILVAEQRFGISGGAVAPAGEAAEAAGPQRPEDPALAAAHDALDAGDLGGAIQAYRNVLADQPGNTEAKLGLAQAELLKRVEGLDLQAVRAAAAADPKDVGTQLQAADLDLVGGHVEDAFGRLVDTVGRTFGEDRDTARLRLLELFEVIGPEDPRVVAARTALARVLF
ncbi:tetratricopeptide repeat protein [Kitasatospora aureofaciens]|uniref:Co-chaperone YbbN n=1 Tax=Kitasatospora aureofaciens TaxID=1894 RepID=A0A1E7N8V3_KITAU|nr:tetratricopeptide repeat protein [Kitasatospora aureofaciens]ARF78658.1 co-chaperone YbbN [Kitasatospora aureofaciens]OEV36893.1 co-chaperone YbbN [Kitasatospora aureofaciens]GGU78439.1 co-chaperone YbbN [Kitasatospora aureofaciens]